MHEQLAQQLPSSFASMSTSFMSPNSGALGQFDGQLPGQYQSLQMPDPHDSAWLQGQVAAALQEQQQSTLAWQQASSALQSPGLNQDVQLLLFAHQQNLLAGCSQGPHSQQQQQQQQLYGQQQQQQQQQQPYDQQHWDQQQQQQQLLLAAGLQGSLQNNPGSLQGAQPQHHAVSSSGEPIWSMICLL